MKNTDDPLRHGDGDCQAREEGSPIPREHAGGSGVAGAEPEGSARAADPASGSASARGDDKSLFGLWGETLLELLSGCRLPAEVAEQDLGHAAPAVDAQVSAAATVRADQTFDRLLDSFRQFADTDVAGCFPAETPIAQLPEVATGLAAAQSPGQADHASGLPARLDAAIRLALTTLAVRQGVEEADARRLIVSAMNSGRGQRVAEIRLLLSVICVASMNSAARMRASDRDQLVAAAYNRLLARHLLSFLCDNRCEAAIDAAAGAFTLARRLNRVASAQETGSPLPVAVARAGRDRLDRFVDQVLYSARAGRRWAPADGGADLLFADPITQWMHGQIDGLADAITDVTADVTADGSASGITSPTRQVQQIFEVECGVPRPLADLLARIFQGGAAMPADTEMEPFHLQIGQFLITETRAPEHLVYRILARLADQRPAFMAGHAGLWLASATPRRAPADVSEEGLRVTVRCRRCWRRPAARIPKT